MFQAIRDVSYDGWLMIESFGFALGDLSSAAAIWRDIEKTPESIAWEGIEFLKEERAYRRPKDLLKAAPTVRSGRPELRQPASYSATRRKRSALAMTDTELNVIAALAIIGLRSTPNTGYSTPAATGTPSTL